MLIIDDLLLRGLGLSPPKPLDMIWMLELIRTIALKEKYNVGQINDQIKENRLLFELEELSEREYKEKQEVLTEKLQEAQEVMEELADENMEIREGI